MASFYSPYYINPISLFLAPSLKMALHSCDLLGSSGLSGVGMTARQLGEELEKQTVWMVQRQSQSQGTQRSRKHQQHLRCEE